VCPRRKKRGINVEGVRLGRVRTERPIVEKERDGDDAALQRVRLRLEQRGLRQPVRAQEADGQRA
jgi:hypothetical protein